LYCVWDLPNPKFLVFDTDTKGTTWEEIPESISQAIDLSQNWDITFQHIDGSTKKTNFPNLMDLKNTTEYVHFSGTIIYSKKVNLSTLENLDYFNLGKVYGISEVFINGKPIGTKWYGDRIYNTNKLFVKGHNAIEIKLTSMMGNYMKTLINNPVAQYWTNEKRKNQPLQSLGICGPIRIY
jgi:hypothetical protein